MNNVFDINILSSYEKIIIAKDSAGFETDYKINISLDFIILSWFLKSHEIVQNSCGLKSSISCSRSVTSLRATDWTRPADFEPGSFVHKIGDILNPTS